MNTDSIWDGMTSTAINEPSIGLTYDSLMKTLSELRIECPIVFYWVSAHIPNDNEINCIPNNDATPIGYDIVCHPSQAENMIRALGDRYDLRLMTSYEMNRRMGLFTVLMTKNG